MGGGMIGLDRGVSVREGRSEDGREGPMGGGRAEVVPSE